MKNNCLVLIDSNICIYRTLALVNPPIYPRTELDGAIDKIHKITNTYQGKIIVSDLVIKELKNKQILFQEIFYFWKEKLHGSRLHSVQRMMRQAEKSIEKFFTKYSIDSNTISLVANYKNHLSKVELFYLKHPERLKEITERKIRNKSQIDANKKLSQRPSNLPEETDRHLLAQSIELRNVQPSDVHILSDDSDFKEFKNEINSEFKVSIISSDSQLDGED